MINIYIHHNLSNNSVSRRSVENHSNILDFNITKEATTIFRRRIFLRRELGRGFCELANYEYDYLGRALDGKPDLSRRCHLTPFPALASDPDLAPRHIVPRNRISRIIGPPSDRENVDDK